MPLLCFDSLHMELQRHIIGFLDIKDMLKFALFVNKKSRNLVTYNGIIEAGAAERSKNRQHRAHSIIKSVIDQALGANAFIFMPSPMRLLRMMNARSCELCFRWFDCYLRSASCPGCLVTHRKDDFPPDMSNGLMVCRDCKETLISVLFSNPSTALTQSDGPPPPRVRLSEPFKDSTRELVGPKLIAYEHEAEPRRLTTSEQVDEAKKTAAAEECWDVENEAAFVQMYKRMQTCRK